MYQAYGICYLHSTDIRQLELQSLCHCKLCSLLSKLLTYCNGAYQSSPYAIPVALSHSFDGSVNEFTPGFTPDLNHWGKRLSD